MNLSDLAPSADSQPHITSVSTGSYPVRRSNLVRPLVDSGPAFRRICEAIEAARHSVWLTVTFMAPDFEMPDGRGSVLDVLDRAVARGLDVRILFWRPNPESSGYGQEFAGSPSDRALLAARGSRFRARWDRAPGAYCQHQKSWLIDAGRETETAFVGGINPTFGVFEPSHRGEGQRHDVYVEVTGPSATDVHHNFVQRWNEASERGLEDGTWGHSGDDALAFPTNPSPSRGESPVQIQRNLGAERSITEQYRQAIAAARRSIYIENQAIPVPEIAAALDAALSRGVEVVVLVPAEPLESVRAARRNPDRKSLFERVAALGRHENFSLAGIAGRNAQGGRSDIYVHAKIMLVDDAWATIGSCNLHASSLFGNTEMNAAFWDPAVVRALRCALLAEHIGADTAALDDRAALALYRCVAHENRLERESGNPEWQGLAFRLDPATYGE